MTRYKVWVEVDEQENPIRIFRKNFGIYSIPKERLRQYPRKDAVEAIRRAVFERDGYECRRCNKVLNWQTGECDEIKSRGDGGEISLANSWLLCHGCHTGDATSEHGDRRPRFSKNLGLYDSGGANSDG